MEEAVKISDDLGQHEKLKKLHKIMSLFGILFGIIMLFLVAKALIETAYGLILVITGIFLHMVAWIFHAFAMFLRLLDRLNKTANTISSVKLSEVSFPNSV